MKFLLMISSFIIFINSCDTVEEVYLYEKGSKEYTALQQLAADNCIKDADIFSRLDATGDFVNSGLIGKIFKVAQDKASTVNMYFKILNVSATEMQVGINGPAGTYDKLVVFEKTDHDALLSELKLAACDPKFKKYFIASSLSSTTTMTLTWNKQTISKPDGTDEGTDPDVYQIRSDVYTFSTSYPLFFYFYNAKKEMKRILTAGQDEEVVTSTISITDVTTNAECKVGDADFIDDCAFDSSTTGVFPTCDFIINAGIYNKDDHDNEFFYYSPKNSCTMLPSTL